MQAIRVGEINVSVYGDGCGGLIFVFLQQSIRKNRLPLKSIEDGIYRLNMVEAVFDGFQLPHSVDDRFIAIRTGRKKNKGNEYE
jgi:hypothetical protein